MRFGPLTLESNLFLSPLAGYTNLPFRLAVREVGGLGLATTDLVNARSLLEKNPKALKLIETCAGGSALSPCSSSAPCRRKCAMPRPSRIARRRLGGHQHGLPGAQGLPRRRRLGHDDRTGQDRRARPRHGRRREDSGHRQDAARLGRREPHRAGPGARALEDVGRGGHFRPWPHARARIWRHGQPGRHPRRGAGGEGHSRHRQRRRHHPAGGENDARRNRLRRREHRARRVLQSVDFPAHAALLARRASCCPSRLSPSACA